MRYHHFLASLLRAASDCCTRCSASTPRINRTGTSSLLANSTTTSAIFSGSLSQRPFEASQHLQKRTEKGATRLLLQPRSLTVEEFHKFLAHLEEPVRTIALICVCFRLRISECLALNWSDIDWLNAKLHVQRSIVPQRVGDVKTVHSGKTMCIDAEMIELLKVRKQTTPFPDDGDWIFASPVKLGRLPVSYPRVWLQFQRAARADFDTLNWPPNDHLNWARIARREGSRQRDYQPQELAHGMMDAALPDKTSPVSRASGSKA